MFVNMATVKHQPMAHVSTMITKEVFLLRLETEMDVKNENDGT
jgi:hypothetical protein